MMSIFDGKIAVITGASRGIGKATAIALARLGATVVVDYLSNAERATETAAELDAIGASYLPIQADVRDFAQVRAMMREVEARFGKFHFLINNAGISRDRTLAKIELEDWHDVMATNLTGVFYCCKAAIDHMVLAEGSRIITISSIVGRKGNFGQISYAAAKSGLLGLTKSLALELARYRVTVNSVAPGFTRTEMFGALPPEVQARILDSIPLKRLAEPEEIAHVAVFLCSPLAGFITGAVLDVNGGMYT